MEKEYILEECVNIIKEAGDIALKFYNNPFTGFTLKEDNSYVTLADVNVETFLREKIKEKFEGEILGEEGKNARISVRSEYVWAIDPIDGTHSFATNLPGWCVSIGLFKKGKPYFGIIYSPVINELYYGGPEFGSFLNGAHINTCLFDGNNFDKNDVICLDSKKLRKNKFTFEGKARSFGSTALHIVFAAKGSACLAYTGKVKIWDIAGAVPIALGAGCVAIYDNGEEVNYKKLFKCNPLEHNLLVGPKNAVQVFLSDKNIVR